MWDVHSPDWASGASLAGRKECKAGFCITHAATLGDYYCYALCDHDSSGYRLSPTTTVACPRCSWEARCVRSLRQAYYFASKHLDDISQFYA